MAEQQPRPVIVSAGGSEVRYVKVTELTGVDISGDTIEAALALLGSAPAEADFAAPASLTFGTVTVDEVELTYAIVGATVDAESAPALGQEYVVHARIVDSPETVVVAAPEAFRVA